MVRVASISAACRQLAQAPMAQAARLISKLRRNSRLNCTVEAKGLELGTAVIYAGVSPVFALRLRGRLGSNYLPSTVG